MSNTIYLLYSLNESVCQKPVKSIEIKYDDKNTLNIYFYLVSCNKEIVRNFLIKKYSDIKNLNLLRFEDGKEKKDNEIDLISNSDYDIIYYKEPDILLSDDDDQPPYTDLFENLDLRFNEIQLSLD